MQTLKGTLSFSKNNNIWLQRYNKNLYYKNISIKNKNNLELINLKFTFIYNKVKIIITLQLKRIFNK